MLYYSVVVHMKTIEMSGHLNFKTVKPGKKIIGKIYVNLPSSLL